MDLISSRILVFIIIIINGVVCNDIFTDETNALLPHLFVLDDYERCLSRQEGLYCLGVFQLTPLGNTTVYQRIQEYSSQPYAFNRSRLHRGYCVSERCPSRARNATRRFERCVSERARSHALSARLHTLHHCTTHAQHINKHTQPPDSLQRLFLQIAFAIIALNIVGTVYDYAARDDEKKIGALMAWSVRSSWRRLTASPHGAVPRVTELDPLRGFKVLAFLMSVLAHTYTYYLQFYITTPHFLENFFHQHGGVMLTNGTSLIQVFTLITNFLTGYSLLQYMETRKLSLNMLPVLIIRRVIRIVPVHLLLVGFTVTWWPRLFTGPHHTLGENESRVCRRKFWSHAFFYNNIGDTREHCLIPSWYFPVDMHLYYVACILVILLQHRRRLARRLCGVAFVLSSAASGVACYINGWHSMLHFAEPETIRGFFTNVASFGEFYVSTWGSMPACFMGLYVAYLYYELRETDYHNNKRLKLLLDVSLPTITAWVIAIAWVVRHNRHPLVMAAYVAIDRPLMIAGAAFHLIGVFRMEGSWRKFLNWKGWVVPSRLSLPVMLCHWLIIPYILARPLTYYLSHFYVMIDFLAIVVLSYLIAVPISLFVEIPVQRFISQFI